MNSAATQYDVIIVGAGIVGSALACALAGSSINVAIVEAQNVANQWPPQTDEVTGYDARVSALTVASQQFLQSLNVWDAMVEHRISPYRKMHVWDADGTGSIDFNAADINEPVLGHIVENRITATALMLQLKTQANIDVIAPAKLQNLSLHKPPSAQQFYQLTLQDGRHLNASLVVAADGANSKVRELAEVTMREWDYGHHAIVTTVETEHPHQQTAWQRFLPEGPLAFLPLANAAASEHFCSVVWSAVPQYVENLMQLDDAEFASALGQAFEYRLGEVKAISGRFSFPLRQRHAVDYIKPCLALVGDAAHTIHPLAGQGVNLGLMDVKVLAEELLRAQQRKLPLGQLHVLERYQRRRKAANLSMMAGMEGFKRLFEQPALPVRWARNNGMRWLNNFKPLKHRIMRQAMGL